MRALLIHNDTAGTDPEPRETIEAVLHEAGIATIYVAHGDEDLATALKTPVDFIIAAGGDGTVADPPRQWSSRKPRRRTHAMDRRGVRTPVTLGKRTQGKVWPLFCSLAPRQ